MAGCRWHLLGHVGGEISAICSTIAPSPANPHRIDWKWPQTDPILHCTAPFSTTRPHSTLHGPNLHCTAPFYTTRPHSDLHRPHSHPSAFSLPPSRLLTPTPLPSHSHLPSFSLPPLRLLTPTFPPSHQIQARRPPLET